MKWQLLCLSILSSVSVCVSYNILCMLPLPSQSHNILARGIVDSLLEAGHEVTWVSAFPEKDQKVENLTVIYVDLSHLISGVSELSLINLPLSFIKDYSRNISKSVAKDEQVENLMISKQFDAVITEWFFTEEWAGYAAVQQAPWIMLVGSVMESFHEDLVDEVRTAAMLPMTMIFNFPVPMNFWQRSINYIGLLAMNILTRYEQLTVTQRFYESLFSTIAEARGVTLPPLVDAAYNISLLFVNSHPSIAPARNLPPNVVDIAGYHIDKNIPPLPKDLQELLDSSKQGVIYFSMGSIIKPSNLFGTLKEDLIKTFGKLPYTILWKFEEQTEELPTNIHIRSWMPQASILAHPSVKLFITHGGQLSSLEAIYHGVPLLSIPIFGDQPGNAERAVRLGFGLKVEFSETMSLELGEKIKKMLQDDSYDKRAKYLSKLFRNRPVPSSKLISHYVELVIESKGAEHLRSMTYLYSWYERWMLDVIFFVIVLLLVVYTVIKKIITLLLQKIRGKESGSRRKKNL